MTSPLKLAFDARVSPSTLRFETLLPEPDSPTMPSERPASTENETPSTARTTPSSVLELDREVLDLEQRHG